MNRPDDKQTGDKDTGDRDRGSGQSGSFGGASGGPGGAGSPPGITGGDGGAGAGHGDALAGGGGSSGAPGSPGGAVPGNDEELAGEYVLGVLTGEERERVAERIETDAAFARLVDDWQARFAPLNEGYQEAHPPAALKGSLDRRLFGEAPGSQARARAHTGADRATAGLWNSLAFWRTLSAGSVVAMLALAAFFAVRPPQPQPPHPLIASLRAASSDVHFVALYDPVKGTLALSHVSGARKRGRDFELWLIAKGDGPRSLGVIPRGGSSVLRPKTGFAKEFAEGASLAISLEPAGGSTGPGPSGPVVAAGKIRKI